MKKETAPSPSIPETGNGICKQCGETYNRKEVARVYGKESAVLAGGFCTPQCYTKYQTAPSIPVKKITLAQDRTEVKKWFDLPESTRNDLHKKYYPERGLLTPSDILDIFEQEGFLSIPVKDENLQKLADLLESRGVRKYLNINNSGYSQIERDIVELFEPKQNPSPLPVKDELLDITKGEWFITKSSLNSTAIATRVDSSMILVIADWRKERKANAKAICTAVNNTYGKGFRPEALEELYKALEGIIEAHRKDHKWLTRELLRGKTALQNAKTIKP